MMRETGRLPAAALILMVSFGAAVAAPSEQSAPAAETASGSAGATIVGISAHEALGAPVKNMQGEDLGELHDVIIDADGNADTAILSVGGFLGIGDKLVALPYDRLFFTRDHVVLLRASREELEKQPAFVPVADRILVTLEKREGAPPSTVDRYLADAHVQMQVWQAKLDDFATKAKQEGRATAEQTKAGVENAWDNLEQQWERLQDSSGDAWKDAQDGFERARSRLEKAWSDAGDEGKSDKQPE